MKIYKLICNYQSISLKNFLNKELNISASLLTKLKHSDGILVNGIQKTVRAILNVGDVVTLIIPHMNQSTIYPVQSNLEVLYEDEDVICVNKPCGIPTHPSHGHNTNTLVNFLAYKNLGTSDEIHVVTRLDLYTSGVAIVAKNQLSASKMCCKEYHAHIQKYYIALCRGYINDNYGCIEVPISRCKDSILKRCVSENGKYSKTEYEVLDTYNNNTLVRLKLHTGRTHQIRVHMAYINHPLLNDFLYDPLAQDTQNHFLHCHRVVFKHPLTNDIIEIVAPVPDYLSDANYFGKQPLKF